MHDFRSLRFLALFRGLFTKFGIDFDAMQKILQVKLTMDERRVPTIFQGNNKKKEGNHFLKSLWVYGLYGLILIPFILLGENYIFQMGIVFAMVMFIVMTSMISDFSSVLLDIRDKNILDTKPISGRTLSAAKMMHVGIYMTYVTGAFAVLPLIISVFKHGPLFGLTFLAGLLFTMLFIVVLTALLYLFVLRFFDGERLKDIINYVQILLSVGVIVGYQVFIRSFEFIDLDVVYSFAWWHFAIPPLWFGALFEVVLHQNYSTYMIGFALLAVIVPIISIYCYARLMPAFERNLEKLLSDTRKRKKKWNGLDELWAKVICRGNEERIFFRFAALMMKQEREFKLKVYPGLGMGLVFPFIFIFNELRDKTITEVSLGKSFLFIYFCNLLIPTIIHMLQFSGNYKGGWIFKAAPIQQLSSIYSGTLKAFLVKLYVPVFLLLSIAFTWTFGVRIIPDLFAILLVGIVQSLITYKLINNETFPFSRSFEFAQSTGGAKIIISSLLIGVFVIAHLLLGAVKFGLYVYIAILFVAVVVGWRVVFPKRRTTVKW
ncbi:hypothetical protein FITA111629_09095 [Filibacter tadaridae]|uniref:Uncharacterized protein n=1 Tax=Filibacter tadaridae TaxID=2483811 RepID=A0A3P5WQ42_9BACL|nr:hypothetical protein [Filibacter tadaridae]VDC21651.1 hypothetical protein FILTAD_00655 [Filibacter tadaridae]